jgi:hypothetical protein
LENSISKKDAVVLLTRLISLYLIFWAITDALALPLELNSFLHYLHEHVELPASVLAGENPASATASYWMRHYFLEVIQNVLRIVLWLFIAGWFYRCGRRIQKFFGLDNQ